MKDTVSQLIGIIKKAKSVEGNTMKNKNVRSSRRIKEDAGNLAAPTQSPSHIGPEDKANYGDYADLSGQSKGQTPTTVQEDAGVLAEPTQNGADIPVQATGDYGDYQGDQVSQDGTAQPAKQEPMADTPPAASKEQGIVPPAADDSHKGQNMPQDPAGSLEQANGNGEDKMSEQDGEDKLEEMEDEMDAQYECLKEARKRYERYKNRVERFKEQDAEDKKNGNNKENDAAEDDMKEMADDADKAEEKMHRERKRFEALRNRIERFRNQVNGNGEDKPSENANGNGEDKVGYEQANGNGEPKPENANGNGDEPKQYESFREEYEDQMGKMADVVERLQEQMDDMQKKVGENGNGNGNDISEMGADEEPKPPMTESARLSRTFVEAVGNLKLDSEVKKNKSFSAAVRSVLLNNA